jgi:NADPH-dependent 2,4-dienoyl-CoA reductase/sulfur reductase-like enzyme
MAEFKYLLVGGGMTADAAAKGIRELDSKGSIGLISAEKDPPYNRPPLTKGLWKGEPEEGIWRKTADANVKLVLGTRIKSLDRNAKQVTDQQGNTYTYETLLLATGGHPRTFPFGGDGILYYRTYEDYRRLRELAASKQRIGVIGGGFIGSEIAAALAMNHKDVVMLMMEQTLNGDRYPKDLGEFLNDYYRQHGVEVVPGSSVTNVEKRGEQYAIRGRDDQTKQEREWVVDAVIAGLGIIPNVELAQQAGLEVNNGIVVNEHLRTHDHDIYAAGDVANVYRPLMGQSLRVEHEDNALTMGRAAGRNMAGALEPYTHQPFFYSDLFDLGYEAVGDMSASLEKVADWEEQYRKGVIYYLKDKRVVGVILWNVWGMTDLAREIIGEPGPFTRDNLKGRIKG